MDILDLNKWVKIFNMELIPLLIHLLKLVNKETTWKPTEVPHHVKQL
jgi:hypothetical protein